MAKLTNGIGLGGETRQLVLGDSFRNYRCNRGPKGLHTIRYDFKPASVDTTKMGDIEFGENNKVTVTMPNVESSGLPQTVFKGSRKPHLKECVLIIDNETGELTLERLAHNITVKKTRAEGSSRAGLPRPITPSFETQIEKSGSSSNSNGNNGNGNNNSYNNNSNNNYNQRKLSPPMINGSINGGRPISPKVSSSSLTVGGHHSLSQGGSPSSFTPKSNRSSPNVAFGLHRSPLVQSSQPSMPTNGLLTSTHIKPDDEMIGILSESSSDSSEHGSSSSDNSDSSSDEDDEIKQEVVEASKSLNDDNYSRAGSSSSSGSDSSSDSEDETGHSTPTPMMTNNSKIKQSPNNGSSSSAILPSMPSMLSMPKFTQLSEDLQLSESGSDSD